jgi:hypothetical protein
LFITNLLHAVLPDGHRVVCDRNPDGEFTGEMWSHSGPSPVKPILTPMTEAAYNAWVRSIAEAGFLSARIGLTSIPEGWPICTEGQMVETDEADRPLDPGVERDPDAGRYFSFVPKVNT